MEKDINELFDALSAEEADRLIRDIAPETTGEELASRLNEKVKAVLPAGESKLRITRPRRRTLWIAAAVLAVLIALSVGTYAYAADAKEYNEAKQFFEEYDIPMDGLTKADIKAVYRDITTESFTYDKTAEVIESYLETNSVPGWEVLLEDPSPENVADFWTLVANYVPETHEWYHCTWNDHSESKDGILTVSHESGTIEKKIGDDIIWSCSSDKMRFTEGITVSDGTLGIGAVVGDFVGPILEDYIGGDDSEREFKPAVTKLDNDGNPVWFCTWDNGLDEETIRTAVQNDDGSVALFAEGWGQEGLAVVVTRIDAQGNRLDSVVNTSNNAMSYIQIHLVIPFDGGYLAMITEDGIRRVVEFDSNGNSIGEFNYSDGEREYRIEDIAAGFGKLYISASRRTLDLYPYVEENDIYEIPEEEFTPMLRENSIASLIVCDLNGGTPEVFYEVEGAFAHEISVDEFGRAEWNVESILSASFRNTSGVYPINGVSKDIRLIFDITGRLVETVDDGEQHVFIIG